jgi:hypothetical protein
VNVCVRPFSRLIAVNSWAMSPILRNVFQFNEPVSWSNLCVKALKAVRVVGQVDVFIEFPAVLFKLLPAFCLFCQQSSCGLSGLRSVCVCVWGGGGIPCFIMRTRKMKLYSSDAGSPLMVIVCPIMAIVQRGFTFVILYLTNTYV